MCTPEVKLVYWGAIIILVFLIVYYLKNLSQKSENLVPGSNLYTSGATMRVVGTQFTSTDQGSDNLEYNDQLKSWNNPGAEQFTVPFFGRNSDFQKIKKKI